MDEKKDRIKKDVNFELRSEDLQDVLGAIPPWILRWGITLIGILVVVLLVGSAIFKYPDIISAPVTLNGTEPAVGIIAKTSGKINELFIVDNQEVNQGEYLAIVENPVQTSDLVFLKNYLNNLNFNLDSIHALPSKNLALGDIQTTYSSFYNAAFNYLEFKKLDYYPHKIKIINDRLNEYKIQYQNMLRQHNVIKKQYSITEKQYRRDSLLHARNILSELDLENTYNQYLQDNLSWETALTNLKNLEIQISQLRESLLDTEQQYTENKNSFETQIRTGITQLLAEIQKWELNYALVAPIDGKISFTNYWAKNQNIVTGNTIFNIIPKEENELIGNALLPMTRSGKVKIGQSVNIRFDNFPDNEFGLVKGVVDNISLVPAENTYIVRVKLPNGLKTTYKKDLPYLPEMAGQADIITEDISLLERFFMPIRKIFTEGIS